MQFIIYFSNYLFKEVCIISKVIISLSIITKKFFILIFKLKYFSNKNHHFRYVVSGTCFTFLSPSIFLCISTYLPPEISFLISDFLIQLVRFNVITIWVFNSNLSRKSLKAYIKSTVPISLLNFLFVSLLSNNLNRFFIAVIIGLFSASFGFLWNKFCYRKIYKNF